jgi:hypothetical protein
MTSRIAGAVVLAAGVALGLAVFAATRPTPVLLARPPAAAPTVCYTYNGCTCDPREIMLPDSGWAKCRCPGRVVRMKVVRYWPREPVCVYRREPP